MKKKQKQNNNNHKGLRNCCILAENLIDLSIKSDFN